MKSEILNVVYKALLDLRPVTNYSDCLEFITFTYPDTYTKHTYTPTACPDLVKPSKISFPP